MMIFIVAFAVLLVYYVIFLALTPALLRKLSLKKEWVRKIQHLGYAFSVLLYVHLFAQWYDAVMAAALFGILAFAGLLVLERLPMFEAMFVARGKKREYRYSLLLAHFTLILLFTLFWGVLPHGDPLIVIISILGWGIGDAGAAVIGKRFGRTHLHGPGIDEHKTFAGSAALYLGVAVTLIVIIIGFGVLPWRIALPAALVIAGIAMAMEAYSKQGLDTLTMPLSIAASLYAVVILTMQMGWM